MEAPEIQNAKIRGYDHRVPNKILPGEFYAEALYECDKGFDFEPPSLRTMYCSEGEWIGRRPECAEAASEGAVGGATPCNAADAAECEQLCVLDDDGAPMCACHEGYAIGGDEKCVDVDECADGGNGGCQQLCVNKPGAFMCDCRSGYRAQV